MRRPLALTFAATLTLAGGLASTRAAATAADDQAAADAAITAFNERMTEAGGVSDGAPDMEPVEPDDYAEEPPASECLGGIDAALEPSGRFEGETARAFSDNFTFASADAPPTTDPMDLAFAESDDVTAGVITVDDAHQAVLDELIATIGSDEVATCLQEEFLAADAAAQAGADGSLGSSVPTSDVRETADSAPPSDFPAADVTVTAEPDIGLGDASAQLNIAIVSTLGDDTFGFSTSIFVARSDRTVAFFTLSISNEPVSDLDGHEELAALLDSL